MRSHLKRFLLGLLLAVLPLQGVAWAAMPGCAFVHPARATQQAPDQPVADTRASLIDSAAMCHEPQPEGKAPTAHDCTHCAACYLASALLLPARDIGSAAPAVNRVVSSADDAFTGFIPDSPERPPRPFFA
ncbi:MAG: hypothetical protein ACLGHA_01670 [Gammaproteobacteria bacterium]